MMKPFLVFLASAALFNASVESAERVNVRDFGAVGDAVTDDTQAFAAAFQSHSDVFVPSGVYVITEGLLLPRGARLTGEGAPLLGVFPLSDDKRLLAEGRKHELPGTTLLFRGAGSRVLETGRSDEFGRLRFGLKTHSASSFAIEKLAIALDVTIVDKAGQWTSPGNDRASDFDVGLLVDDSPAGTVRDVAVFGYWKRAGVAIVSRGVGDNPDYNTFWNCALMGRCGIALLGSDVVEGPGLSGTQFHGCRIFSGDHHNRSFAGDSRAAVFIDGKTSAKRADLNGHAFFGGCVRTYNNTAVELKHASNVSFHGVVFELPGYKKDSAVGRDSNGRIVGTRQTRNVSLFGCRMHDIGLRELGDVMPEGARVLAIPDHRGLPTVYDSGGRRTLGEVP